MRHAVSTRRKKDITRDSIKVQGFLRLQVWDYGPNGEPNHRLVSDTGYEGPNQITNIGFNNFINYVFGANGASKIVGFAAVGTGTTPASNAGSLPGESMARKATTYSTPASTQAQWIASWASSDCTASFTIGNAGLYAHSSELSIFCGKSVTGQTWNTNQSLNLTYQLNFS